MANKNNNNNNNNNNKNVEAKQEYELTLIVQRGEQESNTEMKEYKVTVDTGLVVLDAVNRLQATQEHDLAVRWNCKAGKCGSCSAEINGQPKLMCMTKLINYPQDKPITIKPMHTFPLIKDLVTDVSHNYKIAKTITPFIYPTDLKGEAIIYQNEVERIQEFRKCIECFLCQDICHVLRSHGKYDEYVGPRFLIKLANYEMHPLDQGDRLKDLWEKHGIGYCNITRCCSEVCPESIEITHNAIIPLKERVADRSFDPIRWAWRKISGKKRKNQAILKRVAKS